MSKKRSIWKFAILAVIIVIGLVLTFGSFKVAGTVYNYNGFINSIPLGADLNGGISVVYESTVSSSSNTDDLDSAIDSTMSSLKNILYNHGISDVTIVKQSSDKIRIEIPDQENDVGDLFEFIGQPISFYLSENQNFDVENPTGEYLSSKDISNIYLSYSEDGSSIGIAFNFNSQAKEVYDNFSDGAKNDSKTLYVFIGDESGISVTSSNFPSDNTLFVSGGVVSSSTASEYYIRLTSGTYSANLSLFELTTMSASLGQNAIMLSAIAIALSVLVVMVIMFIRYRELGLMANISLVIFAILFSFFLQAVPYVEMSLAGIGAVLLSLILFALGNILILERVKEEYASGRKIPLAVKNAYKKSIWTILDVHIVTLICSILLYILGTPAIKSFAMVLLIGTVVACFCSLIITKMLIKWYLPLNSTNPKRMALKRSKLLNEVYSTDTQKVDIVEGGESND